jgi:hypothetical protein
VACHTTLPAERSPCYPRCMTYLRRPSSPTSRHSTPLRNPPHDSPDVERPASMPPRLASRLHAGFNTRISHQGARSRARQISESRYAPYQPIYDLLKGTSMLEVARQTNIPYAMVSRILRGLAEPPFYAGMLLARAIGCTPDELDLYLAERQRSPLRPAKLADSLARAAAATAWREDMTETLD